MNVRLLFAYQYIWHGVWQKLRSLCTSYVHRPRWIQGWCFCFNNYHDIEKNERIKYGEEEEKQWREMWASTKGVFLGYIIKLRLVLVLTNFSGTGYVPINQTALSAFALC